MSHLQDSQKKHRQRLRPIFGVTTIKATCGCECHGCHYFSGCETQGLFQDFPVPFQANLGRITELGFNFLNKIIVFFVDFSINVSIHIRTKELVARGFKIIQLLRADI